MTAPDVTIPRHAAEGKAGVSRCALTGAAVLATLFAVCWIAALVNVPGVSHMYLGLSVAGPGGAIGALIFGVICSGVAGLLIGALTAFTYNFFAFVDRT
jgi:hypothetical protein